MNFCFKDNKKLKGTSPWTPIAQEVDGGEVYKRRLKELNVSEIPLGFGLALAIASDRDRSKRKVYQSYIKALSEERGLDFGDSASLRSSSGKNAEWGGGFLYEDGSDPFSINFISDWSSDSELFPFEVLRDYFSGNIDHLHGTSPIGERVIFPEISKSSSNGKEHCLLTTNRNLCETHGEWLSAHCLVGGVILSSNKRIKWPEKIIIRTSEPEEIVYYRQEQLSPRYWKHPNLQMTKSVCLYEPRAQDTIPRSERINEILLKIPSPKFLFQREPIICCTFLNCPISRVKKSLEYLAQGLNVKITLFTDHTGFSFRNPTANKLRYEKTALILKKLGNKAGYPYSYQADDVGFMLGGDEISSVVYLLPWLKRELGLRYVNPSGFTANLKNPVSVFDLIDLVIANDKSYIYLAKRCFPAMKENVREQGGKGGGPFGFIMRLRTILDCDFEEDPLACVLYCHLGASWEEDEYDDIDIIESYNHQVYDELQERIMGFNHQFSCKDRIWFARASSLYEYSLLLRHVAIHSQKLNDNTLSIDSAPDKAVGEKWPRDENELNGLTFFVENAEAGQILLNGKKIENITRCVPEADNPWIMAVGTHFSYTVFDEINPNDHKYDGTFTVVNGEWTWIKNKEETYRGVGFGRLKVDKNGKAEVIIFPENLSPWATQFLAYSVRQFCNTIKYAIVVETKNNGIFLFGNDSIVSREKTASREDHPLKVGIFIRRIMPFSDMKWTMPTDGLFPLPSHPIKSIRLIAQGEPFSSIDFDSLEFIRPGTKIFGDELLVGGQVSNAFLTGSVKYEYCKNNEVLKVGEVRVHERTAFFILGKVSRGTQLTVHAITKDGIKGKTKHIEIWSNRLDLMLGF